VTASTKAYAACLESLGHRVFEHGGVHWYQYNRFLRPVGLPHALPEMSTELARTALRISRLPFVRWESDVNTLKSMPWWFVIRKGPYALDQLSGNTRSKIRRGARRLVARLATPDEIADQGMDVCRQAVERYGNREFAPDQHAFDRKVRTAEYHPEHFHFFGVFADDRLVGYSENHVQERGVFWESIWYDPAHLRHYSSYLLTHAMLDHYLNQEGIDYVSDGCRSIYHDTNVQAFFFDKFLFERLYARLHCAYSPGLSLAVRMLHAFKKWTRVIRPFVDSKVMAQVNGLTIQEEIHRACKEG